MEDATRIFNAAVPTSVADQPTAVRQRDVEIEGEPAALGSLFRLRRGHRKAGIGAPRRAPPARWCASADGDRWWKPHNQPTGRPTASRALDMGLAKCDGRVAYILQHACARIQ
jgi:hypothetical protein